MNSTVVQFYTNQVQFGRYQAVLNNKSEKMVFFNAKIECNWQLSNFITIRSIYAVLRPY